MLAQQIIDFDFVTLFFKFLFFKKKIKIPKLSKCD
jgi:hypothetical protein